MDLGKKTVRGFREYNDLFKGDYIETLDRIDSELNSIREELGRENAKGSVYLKLMELYNESENSLETTIKDWESIRDSFESFVAQARRDLQGTPVRSRDEALETKFYELSDNVNKIRSKRCESMFLNAKSIFASMMNF